MADSTPKSYHTDPTLYLYTSLTSGSSHIISATSRMQTILKANKVEFQALDVATDEKARMLWGRRAGKRKLPGLVRFGMVVGDLEEVEEWNEYGELKENVNLPGPATTAPVTPSPSTTATPSKAPSKQEQSLSAKTAEATAAAPTSPKPESAESKPEAGLVSSDNLGESSTKDGSPVSSGTNLAMAMRQAGFEAAKKAGDAKTKARQEELEKLKAKSTDLQKPDQSRTSENPPPKGAADAVLDQKTDGTTQASSEATKDILATHEEKEGTSPVADRVEAKDTELSQSQIASAAEAEMTKSANAATTEAAEPDTLQDTAASQPEPATPSKKPKLSTDQKATPHVLNAKEAEEEANKAIIADEATHVHIAGSPPPFASPGMKPPPQKDEVEESASPINAAFKVEVEQKEAESKITPIDSKDEEPEQDVDEKEPEKHVEAIQEPSKAVTEAEDHDEKDEGDEEDPGGVGVPTSKAEEVAPTTAKPETEEEPKHTPAISGADDLANTLETPTKHADTTSPKEEKKTQEQPAASAKEAGRSVDD